jgi:hypothetical protein
VLWSGAPDSVRCTRTVQGSSSHSRVFAGALRYNSPDCPVCLSYEPAGNGYLHATVDCKSTDEVNNAVAEVRAAKSDDTGLSGAAMRQSSNSRLRSEP